MSAAAGGTGSHFASSSKGRSASQAHGAGTPASHAPAAGSYHASPSETEEFLAVAAATAAPSYEQPAPTVAADAEPQQNRPVNPLVAARNGGSASGGDTGLFPIQDIEKSAGRSFDTSFADGGRKKTGVIVVVVLLLVALVAAGVFFGLRWKGANDARANIDEALSILCTTDDVIVALDSSIASTIASGAPADGLSAALLQSTTTYTNLSNAESLANEAYASRDLLGADDITAASAVLKSVTARRSLLEEGQALQGAANGYTTALDSLAMAYGSIAEAADATGQSQWVWGSFYETLAVGGDTSGFDLWATLDVDNAAIAAAQAAQSSVQAARDAFDGASYDALSAYLDAYVYQLGCLQQLDTARLNGDEEGINNWYAAYVDAVAAADAAWAACPQTADDLLAGTFAPTASAQRDAYEAARQQCVDADAALNDYLTASGSTVSLGLSAQSALAALEAQAQLNEAAAPVEETVAEGDVPAEGEAPVEG